MKRKIYITTIIILIIDQISKILCDMFLELNKPVIVIDNFFNLNYVQNEGAAWSILSGKRIILIVIGVIALYFLNLFIKDFKENKKNIIAFGLLLGGTLGNLLDRVFLGYVRDFLDFRIFGYNYPVFNIGDIGIVLGALLLIIASINGEDNGISSRRKH